jgi:hypothetical protein
LAAGDRGIVFIMFAHPAESRANSFLRRMVMYLIWE